MPLFGACAKAANITEEEMANDIYFTGVSSGLDWGSIVDKLVQIERAPQTKVKIEAAVAGLKKEYWGSLSTKIAELQNYAEKLRKTGGDVFSGMKASVTDKTIASVSVTDKKAPATSYSISVSSLASAAVKTGGVIYTASNSQALPALVSSSAGINSSGNTINAAQSISSQAGNFEITPGSYGEFTVNGFKITWNDSDSLNTVLSKINSSGAGVTASFDSVSQKVNLTSNAKGASALISLSESSGGILAALKISEGTVYGSDAVKFSQEKPLNSPENHMDRTVTEGIFTINGIMFYVDPDTDSLNTVLSRINSSSAGVNASYDSVNNKINIVSAKTGLSNGIILGAPEDTSNFLYAVKLSDNLIPSGGAADSYFGNDAVFTVNGGTPITSAVNTIDGVIPGLSIRLSGIGSTSIVTEKDRDAIKTAIKDFAAKFNDVMSFINSKLYEEKIPQSERKSTNDYFLGSFRGSGTLNSIRDTLSSIASGSAASLPSSMRMLEQAGIKLTVSADYKTSTMVVDEAKLDEKLSSDFESVKNLFYSTDGFASKFYNAAYGLNSVSGVLAAEKTALDSVISADNNRITEYESRIKETEKRLKQQFSRMESALSKMKNQQAWLVSMAAGLMKT